MTQIYIPRRPLRAMLHIASKFDVRFYLVGVYVEASPDETRLTATDGSILGTYRYILPKDAERNDCGTGWRGILTRESVEALPKPNKYDPPDCMLSDGSGVLRLDDGAPVTLHDATFPDYRALFASMPKVAGATAQFSPELLARFVKFAGDGLERKKAQPSLRHHGEKGALVGFAGCPEFAGSIMPLRLDAPVLPSWVAEPVGVAAEPEPQQVAA